MLLCDIQLGGASGAQPPASPIFQGQQKVRSVDSICSFSHEQFFDLLYACVDMYGGYFDVSWLKWDGDVFSPDYCSVEELLPYCLITLSGPSPAISSLHAIA